MTGNTEYAGQEGAEYKEPTPKPKIRPTIVADVQPVKIGKETFQNPFFWIMVGAVGSVAVYYFLIHKPKQK